MLPSARSHPTRAKKGLPWAGPDPETGDVWLATGYIPPAAGWDGYDNWGTCVFAVSGH